MPKQRYSLSWQRRQKLYWLLAWCGLALIPLALLGSLVCISSPASVSIDAGDELLSEAIGLSLAAGAGGGEGFPMYPLQISGSSLEQLERRYSAHPRFQEFATFVVQDGQQSEWIYGLQLNPMLLQQIRKGTKSPALLWLGLTEQREGWSVKLDCFADLDYTRRNSASYNAEVLNRQLEAALQQKHGAELAAWQMELEGLMPGNAVCHYYRAARLAETGYTKEALAELSAGNARPECRFPLRYPISLLHEQIASGTQPRDKSLGALLAALEYSSEGRIGSLHEEWYSLLFTQLLAQQDVEGIGVLETALLRLARAEGVKQEHCGEILDFLSTSTGALGAGSAGASGGKGSTLQQHCNDINSLRVHYGFLYNQGLVNVPAGGQYQGLRALLLQPLIYEDYERLVREQYCSDAVKLRRAVQPGGSLHEKLKSLEGFDYSAWIKASPGGLVTARQGKK